MKNSKIKYQLYLILIFLCFLGTQKQAEVSAMSVTLGDGKTYPASCPSGAENRFTVEKNGSLEVLTISDIKNIDFSDEKNAPAETDKKVKPGVSPEILEILSKVPDKSKFPNAGGYIIKDEDVYTLNADGTYKIVSHYIFKIFEDRAIDNGITAGYAFERESARILMGRTISEDGTVYDLDLSDIKTGDMFRGAKFYSNTYKIMSATLPNVKKGSIIEYKIERNVFKPIIEGYFTPAIYFGSVEPAYEVRLEVRMPKGKKLQWIAKNFDRIYDKNFEAVKSAQKPEIIEKPDCDAYIFRAVNVPEIIQEPSMPPLKDVVPRVQCSAYENWDKIYEWDIKNLGENMARISDELKAKTLELTKNCKTSDEKIAAIYHYVQQEIRYISIKGDVVAGRAGHPAKEVFENKYGDCTDKSILMGAMLGVVGITCYPAAILAGGGDWDPEVAHIDSNHKISFLSYDSKEIFLDSTSQNTRFPFFRADDHGRNCLVSQARRMVRSGTPVSNVKSSCEVVIKADKSITISGVREFDGHLESSIRGRNKSLKESEIKDIYKSSLNQTLPGVELKKLNYTDLMDLNKPVVETYEYNAPEAVIAAGELMLFSVPGYEMKFNETSLKQRNYPIDYAYLTNTEKVYNFKLPEGYKVKYLPGKLEIDNKYMLYRAEFVKAGEDRVVFSDKLERKLRMVDPADYESYKADCEKIKKYCGEKVVISR
ncbi:MAG: Transglutaminase-like superfamily protein [bacterium ADurb.Bin243]|nr:MAG: Transglutaminase-like superfamily protein [bacterium ADurb.Bin243]